MRHYYKIEDEVEIRLTVLYTLLKSRRALTAYEISHIILGSAIIDFFDIHEALSYLTDAQEIYTLRSMDDKILYALSASGKAGAEGFCQKLPLEVREYIDECLDELFKEQINRDRLKAKSVPVNFDEFEAHIELNENRHTLLDMHIFAGDEKLAQKMCRNFRKKSVKIYDTIISMLTEDD